VLNLPLKTVELIKNKLLRQQKEVEENLEEVKSDDPAMESIAEPSEPGTDSYVAETHTKTLVLENHLKKTHSSIKEALQKIKKGTYGQCEKCGKQIGLARLMVMPMATYCLSCSFTNKQSISLKKKVK